MTTGAKYWEMIADKLASAGWSYGMVGYWNAEGKRMHAIDASRDGVRHIVHADDLLAGFLELEASIAEAVRQA
jgi:hypothetical protein